MAALINWLKQTVSRVADPDRERRIELHTDALHRELGAQWQAFQLQPTLTRLQVDSGDMTEVCERVYQRILAACWEDHNVSSEERQGMEWGRKSLKITAERAGELNWQAGFELFQRFLGRAMEDATISAEESAYLGRIAAGMGTSVVTLIRKFFSDEGTQFLRGVFAAIAEDGNIAESEWRQLLETTSRLGLTQEDLSRAIEPHARRFVEHVLADAKADEVLSPEENRALSWIEHHLPLSQDFRAYLSSEVADLQVFTDIRRGKLPSLVPRLTIELRSGEIVHFEGPATFQQVRNRKSGAHVESHPGQLTITDVRAVFASSTKAVSLNHRNVVAINPYPRGLEVQTTVKSAAGWYDIPVGTRLGFAIYLTAVRRANQTVVEEVEGPDARYIPRDVRQRVWQRFGGRCSACQSNQYLEYDHIIPVGKGGSNSDANVQLLCRACNLKKSDHI